MMQTNEQVHAAGGGFGPPPGGAPPGGFGPPPGGGFGPPPGGAPPGGFGPPGGAPPGGFGPPGGAPPGGFGPPGGAPPGGYGPPGGAPPGGYGPPPGAPPAFGAAGGPPAPSPYGGPPMATGPKQQSTMAVVSLVAAIASWFFCYGLGGLIAVITGVMARKEIKANPNKFTGEGLATAGLVIGAINLAVAVLGAIGYIIFVVILGAAAVAGH